MYCDILPFWGTKVIYQSRKLHWLLDMTRKGIVLRDSIKDLDRSTVIIGMRLEADAVDVYLQ